MSKQTSRRIPPANSVPQGGVPVMPRRHRRGRSYDPRRLPALPVSASLGAASLASVPAAFVLGAPFAVLGAVLFVLAIGLFALLVRQVNLHPHSDTRTFMIQDLLRGLFGTSASPVPPTGLPTSDATTPPALPDARPSPVVPEVVSPAARRASENPSLPTVVRPVVEGIESKIERILGSLGKADLGDTTAAEMTNLRDVHLPELISSYVDIPSDQRARIFQEKGKSASYVLKDSLDVISKGLDDTITRLAQREISSFDDANRFITDRYGKKKDPFE